MTSPTEAIFFWLHSSKEIFLDIPNLKRPQVTPTKRSDAQPRGVQVKTSPSQNAP